jgi:anti-anti-sigma factor
MLEIAITQQAHVTVALVSGSLDALTSDRLTAALTEQIEAGRVRLVGDLSGVEYTSSAGLRALLGVLKEARRQGGDLRLAAARDAVRRVLDMSGFTGIIKSYPDTAAAVASYPA